MPLNPNHPYIRMRVNLSPCRTTQKVAVEDVFW